MGFLAPIVAGYAQGRRDHYAKALERQRRDAEEAEKRREFDLNFGLWTRQADAQDAYYRSLGQPKPVDPVVAQQNAANREFEKNLKLPPGFSAMDPQRKIDYLLQRQNRAQQVGDDAVVKQTQDQINAITQGATRLANAAYTSGPRTELAHAQIDLLDARTVTERQRPPLLQAQTLALRDLPARAREIARGHDAAALQRARLEIQGRAELARYNANVRVGLEELAAAHRAAGQEVTNAVHLAIAEMTNKTRLYLAQTDPKRTILGGGDPTQAAPPGGIDPAEVQRIIDSLTRQPASPGVTLNVNIDPLTGQVQPSRPMRELSPTQKAQLAAVIAAQKKPGANLPPGAPVPPLPTSPRALEQLRNAQAAIARGATVDDVIRTLEANAAKAGLTPKDVQAIKAVLQRAAKPRNIPPLPVSPIRGLELKPLPIPGGSKAAPPFAGN